MGTEVIAAMSITSTVENISFTLLLGIGSACGIIVGQKIGEGNEDEALEIGKKYLKATVIFGIFSGVLLAATSKILISLFHVNQDVTDIALKNVFIISIFNVFRGANFTIICGILRSGGDTKYTLVIETLSLWLFGIPLAFISGLVLKLPVNIVYLLVSLEEIIKVMFVLKRVMSKKWINNLVKKY
jgi:Na+-driven multidrug efflux pump